MDSYQYIKFNIDFFGNTNALSEANKAILRKFMWIRENGGHDGDVKFSTPLLIPKACGFGGSAIWPKREKKDDQTGYYLSASNKCSIKRWREKEFEGRQRLAKSLWKAKPSAPFSVTMQATDDKAKMASADRGCSSAPLFHGPQMGWEGGVVHVWVCVLYKCVWD